MMKKITLLILLVTTTFTFGQDVWTFDGTTSAYNWDDVLTNCTIDPSGDGIITVNFTEATNNPYFENQNLGVLMANASAYPVVAVTLRQNDFTDGPGHMRFTYPKKPLVDGGTINKGVELNSTDNNWHTYYVDLSGNHWGISDEASLRINFKAAGNGTFTAPANSSIDIDKIEFLAEIPLPEKTDYTFDANGDNEGWDTTANGTQTVSGGSLSVSLLPDGTPASNKITKLDNISYNINADTYKYIYVYYKNVSPNDNLRFAYSSPAGNKNSNIDITSNMLISDEFAIAEFDYTGNSFWYGTASTFQFQVKDKAYQAAQEYGKGCTTQGTFIIDRILFSSTVLSTEDITREDANISLYPNPVSNNFTVNSTNPIEKIEVYNLLGQKVLSQSSPNVNVSNLSKGVYISKIYQENDIVSTKRFVKN